MKDKQLDNQIVFLGRAFLVGIILDFFWLAIVYAIWGFKEGAFFVVSIVSVAHLVSSIGLVIYRNGESTDSDLNYIRFGLLFALWQLLNICC